MTMQDVALSIQEDIAELVKDATSLGYKAGYSAGQEAMRERAAVESWSSGMDDFNGGKKVDDPREVGSRAAKRIRAMPID